MKKIDNNGLQVFGIIVSIVAIAGILQPLVKALFGSPLHFMIFGLVPDGVPALVVWIAILVIGLVLVSITKPLQDKAKQG